MQLLDANNSHGTEIMTTNTIAKNIEQIVNITLRDILLEKLVGTGYGRYHKATEVERVSDYNFYSTMSDSELLNEALQDSYKAGQDSMS
jgi:hypothetical protein